MIAIAPQRSGAENAQYLTAPVPIPALARLGAYFGQGHLSQQALQEPSAILEQGSTQRAFDPFGGRPLALLQPLLEELAFLLDVNFPNDSSSPQTGNISSLGRELLAI